MPAAKRGSLGFFFFCLFGLLLLLLGRASASLEKPEIVNETKRAFSSLGLGIPQGNKVVAAAVNQLKNALDASLRHKNKTTAQIARSNSSTNTNNSNSGIVAEAMIMKKNSTTLTKVAPPSLDLKKAVESRRSSLIAKYPNNQAQKDNHRLQEEKAYVAGEDYDQQAQNYNQEYYPTANYDYEEKYSTIAEDHNNVNPYYDGALTDPWRASYGAPPEPNYYAHPIVQEDHYYGPPSPPGASPGALIAGGNNRGCYCPHQSTRQIGCNNPAQSFLALARALGQNAWALIQLAATSSLPFIIPLLAIKMIVVPLKILKILKLLKLFLKFFVILPLLMRILSPAISQISIPNVFQSIQDMFPTAAPGPGLHPGLQRPHPKPHSNFDEDEEFELEEAREEVNSSRLRKEDEFYFGSNASSWDFRACPSRVACEMGVYLAGAMSLPGNLDGFISRKADWAEGRAGRKKKEKEEEEEDDVLMQDVAFKAFLIALGKKWTQEQCDVYRCWLLA